MVLLSLFLSWRQTLFTHSTNNLAIRPTQLIFLRFFQIQNGFTFHFPPLDAKAITQFTRCTCPTQLILLRLTHSKWFYFTFSSLGGIIRYSHTLHRVRTMCFGCIWVIIRKREMALLAIKETRHKMYGTCCRQWYALWQLAKMIHFHKDHSTFVSAMQIQLRPSFKSWSSLIIQVQQ